MSENEDLVQALVEQTRKTEELKRELANALAELRRVKAVNRELQETEETLVMALVQQFGEEVALDDTKRARVLVLPPFVPSRLRQMHKLKVGHRVEDGAYILRVTDRWRGQDESDR